MIYGPSGHGKTRLAAFAPNATFLSTEKGVVSAKAAGSEARLIRTPSWEHVVAGKKKADAELGPGDWLILDSLTKMQVLMIRWILRKINATSPHRDLDIPAIQDHQKWQNYFKRFVDELIDAPYNVIFICTTMLREDEEGDDQVLPAITGRGQEICDYVCAQMDVTLYYALSDKTPDGEPIRRALAQPFPPYTRCKDRYDVLGFYVDVPNGYNDAMSDMIYAIESGEPLRYEEEE